jgi:GNAT superfamily N-acetyltransferase
VPADPVRRASEAQALPVAELLLRSRRATPGIPPGPHSDDELRTWFREVCFRSREVWVATDGGALRAMMVIEGDWVEQLFVAPEHLRQGQGSRLLNHAQSIRDELMLWCFEANTPARAFYERHGFHSGEPASADNEELAPAIKYRWSSPRRRA